MKQKSFWLLLLASLSSAVPSYFIPFMHTDEGGWATLGQYTFSGGLYQLVTDHKPPLLMQIHWLFSFGEHWPAGAHLFASLWMGLGAYWFFKILIRFFDSTHSLYAALLLALLNGLVNQGTFSPERIYLPFLCLNALFALRSIESGKPLQKYFYALFAGISIGAAAAVKQPAVLFAAPVFWLLILERNFFLPLCWATLGIFTMTALSWWATRTPYDVIWTEAYAVNFEYIRGYQSISTSQAVENLKNIALVLGVYYLPVTIGSISALAYVRKLFKPKKETILLAFLFIVTLISVCLGKRFYQNYFVSALPLLCVLTIISLTAQKSALKRNIVFSLAILAVLGCTIRTTAMQLSDRNKNWNASIRETVSQIEKDTLPGDTIWISHNLFSIYWATHRQPAVKYIFFHHITNYVDICRAQTGELRESLANVNYLRQLYDLDQNKPKVILWVQNHENSCTDRLLLSNFPSLAEWIERHYDRMEENKLGIYFKRKAEDSATPMP